MQLQAAGVDIAARVGRLAAMTLEVDVKLPAQHGPHIVLTLRATPGQQALLSGLEVFDAPVAEAGPHATPLSDEPSGKEAGSDRGGARRLSLVAPTYVDGEPQQDAAIVATPPAWSPPPGVAACVPIENFPVDASIIKCSPTNLGFGDIDPDDIQACIRATPSACHITRSSFVLWHGHPGAHRLCPLTTHIWGQNALRWKPGLVVSWIGRADLRPTDASRRCCRRAM